MTKTDLESRLRDLELRSEKNEELLSKLKSAIIQATANDITREEQISYLFNLLIEDGTLEKIGGVN